MTYQGSRPSDDLALLVVLRPMARALEFVLSVVPGNLQQLTSSYMCFRGAQQDVLADLTQCFAPSFSPCYSHFYAFPVSVEGANHCFALSVT